jgi:signal transduction histidine kinase
MYPLGPVSSSMFTFVRLSARPTGNEHSTGLGLYVVKKMCERLAIDVRVESELGQGATFILEQTMFAPSA